MKKSQIYDSESNSNFIKIANCFDIFSSILDIAIGNR